MNKQDAAKFYEKPADADVRSMKELLAKAFYRADFTSDSDDDWEAYVKAGSTTFFEMADIAISLLCPDYREKQAHETLKQIGALVNLKEGMLFARPSELIVSIRDILLKNKL